MVGSGLSLRKWEPRWYALWGGLIGAVFSAYLAEWVRPAGLLESGIGWFLLTGASFLAVLGSYVISRQQHFRDQFDLPLGMAEPLTLAVVVSAWPGELPWWLVTTAVAVGVVSSRWRFQGGHRTIAALASLTVLCFLYPAGWVYHFAAVLAALLFHLLPRPVGPAAEARSPAQETACVLIEVAGLSRLEEQSGERFRDFVFRLACDLRQTVERGGGHLDRRLGDIPAAYFEDGLEQARPVALSLKSYFDSVNQRLEEAGLPLLTPRLAVVHQSLLETRPRKSLLSSHSRIPVLGFSLSSPSAASPERRPGPFPVGADDSRHRPAAGQRTKLPG